MQCDSASEMLDAYLDGELSPEASAAMRDHLQECPRCSAQIAETARLQRALPRARTHFTPTAEFRQRIAKQFGRPRRRSWGLPWMPLAGAAAAALLLFLLWRGRPQPSDAIAEVADLHVNALASTNPVDVVSTDRHTVKPWFQGKIPFSFNLPELQNSDFTLIGGRVTYLGQVPGAHLIYQVRKHQISVFIFPEDLVSLRTGSKTAKERSFNLQIFTQEGLRYIVFGDVA